MESIGEDLEDLAGRLSWKGQRGGSGDTGEFMTACGEIRREDGTVETEEVEVSAHNLRRRRTLPLRAGITVLQPK